MEDNNALKRLINVLKQENLVILTSNQYNKFYISKKLSDMVEKFEEIEDLDEECKGIND